MAIDSNILEGTFADYVQAGIGKLKKIQDVLMVGQRVGEYEIRTSLFVSELTLREWQTKIISPERIRELKDKIAITQGIFSKIDSPLWLQTWYGRLFLQMNRWRVTNFMLLRRLIKEKNYKGLTKAFILWGTGMYLANEFAKAGYKQASQIAQSMAEEINSNIQLITLTPIVKTLTDNPTWSVLKEIAFSIEELASYIKIPSIKKPSKIEFRKGIEETYIAPIVRPKQLLDALGIGISDKNFVEQQIEPEGEFVKKMEEKYRVK
jgi:hypothetical protein